MPSSRHSGVFCVLVLLSCQVSLVLCISFVYFLHLNRIHKLFLTTGFSYVFPRFDLGIFATCSEIKQIGCSLVKYVLFEMDFTRHGTNSCR